MEVDGANDNICFQFVLEDVLQLNLWWKMEYKGLHIVIIRDRAPIFFIEKA